MLRLAPGYGHWVAYGNIKTGEPDPVVLSILHIHSILDHGDGDGRSRMCRLASGIASNAVYKMTDTLARTCGGLVLAIEQSTFFDIYLFGLFASPTSAPGIRKSP